MESEIILCSIDFDEDDSELSPSLRESLKLYLSRKVGGGGGDQSQRHTSLFRGISPEVKDFLALQKIKELFPPPKTADTV